MRALTNSALCAAKLRDIWDEKLLSKECTYVLFLDSNRRTKFYAELCAGCYDHTPFDKREALQYALNIHCNHIVIGHNHPSGDPNPSQSDIDFTIHYKYILADLGIVLIDHIILTANEYYSFSDHGIFDSKISA